jgi:hypothetical protein
MITSLTSPTADGRKNGHYEDSVEVEVLPHRRIAPPARSRRFPRCRKGEKKKNTWSSGFSKSNCPRSIQSVTSYSAATTVFARLIDPSQSHSTSRFPTLTPSEPTGYCASMKNPAKLHFLVPLVLRRVSCHPRGFHPRGHDAP